MRGYNYNFSLYLRRSIVKVKRIQLLVNKINNAKQEGRNITIYTEVSLEGFYRLEQHNLSLKEMIIEIRNKERLFIGRNPRDYVCYGGYDLNINIDITDDRTYSLEDKGEATYMNNFSSENEKIERIILKSSSKTRTGIPNYVIHFYIQTIDSKIENEKCK